MVGREGGTRGRRVLVLIEVDLTHCTYTILARIVPLEISMLDCFDSVLFDITFHRQSNTLSCLKPHRRKRF